MASTYALEIVTPDRKFFNGQVEMLITRTSQGDIGILKGHENMVAPLAIGSIQIKQDDAFRVAACTGGFMTVSGDKVTLITDAAEWAEEINVERAVAAMERAKARLADSRDKNTDLDRAKIALAKALNRLRATGKEL